MFHDSWLYLKTNSQIYHILDLLLECDVAKAKMTHSLFKNRNLFSRG